MCIDLRSDTVTLPSPAMLARILKTPLGDDTMREDPTVTELEARFARLLGMEDALLVTSGTMANQVAVMTLTDRGDEVVVGPESHIYNLEASALAAIAQVQVRLAGSGPGVPLRQDIEEAVSVLEPGQVQPSPTGLICLENAYDLNAGRVLSVADHDRIIGMASELGIPVYLDGARIFNAAAALGVAVDRLCRGVTAVQVCLTKGLGAPFGSILAGTSDFVRTARRNRQRLGGGMRQAGIMAAPALYAMDHMMDQFTIDNRRARELAERLAPIDGLTVPLSAIDTNIIPLTITREELSAPAFAAKLGDAGVRVKVIGPQRVRMVTHVNITDAALERTETAVKDALR